jgi:hypothetical protein
LSTVRVASTVHVNKTIPKDSVESVAVIVTL